MSPGPAPTITSIVEGHGELAAVPVLLRRIAAEVLPDGWADVRLPYRMGRGSMVKDDGTESAVRQVLTKHHPCDALLIILDADDDCPATLGPTILDRVTKAVGGRARTSVVLANREFESWFVASAESLAGVGGLPADLITPFDPEKPRDAKGWLSHRLVPGPYRSQHDQAGFASRFDMSLARRNAPSFDKFWRDVSYLLTGERGLSAVDR